MMQDESIPAAVSHTGETGGGGLLSSAHPRSRIHLSHEDRKRAIGARQGDLQRLLRERIDVISRAAFIAEEFGERDDSRRRIDRLEIDTDANLVVIQLKRTDDGGHMELPAIS